MWPPSHVDVPEEPTAKLTPVIRAPLGLDPHSKVEPQPYLRPDAERFTKPTRSAAAEKRAKKAKRAARKRQRKA